MIQAATNMFNEYFDYMRGLDTAESVGIAGAITQDGVQPRMILRCAVLLLGLAALLGVYLCLQTTWWLAAIGGASMLVGYLYTGGPYPIAATPLGELFAGGFMGSGIVLLSCFIQQGSMNAYDVLVSIPSAILIAAILTANNIRDLKADRDHGRARWRFFWDTNGPFCCWLVVWPPPIFGSWFLSLDSCFRPGRSWSSEACGPLSRRCGFFVREQAGSDDAGDAASGADEHGFRNSPAGRFAAGRQALAC